jgi:hypothetical protein
MIKAFFGSVPATVYIAPAPPSTCPLPEGAANREPLQLASCSFVIICLNGIEIQAVYSVNSMRPKLIRCPPGVTGLSGRPCQGLAWRCRSNRPPLFHPVYYPARDGLADSPSPAFRCQTAMPDRSFLGLGTTALAVLLPDNRRVLKSPHPEPDARARLEVEAKVYQRFADSRCPSPSSILRYYGRAGDGIILEYAEKGELRGYLRRAMGNVERGAVFR